MPKASLLITNALYFYSEAKIYKLPVFALYKAGMFETAEWSVG